MVWSVNTVLAPLSRGFGTDTGKRHAECARRSERRGCGLRPPSMAAPPKPERDRFNSRRRSDDASHFWA